MNNSLNLALILSGLLIIFSLVAVTANAQNQPAPPEIEKISEEEVNQQNVSQARELADKILAGMAEGNYYEFAEGEATTMVEQQFTPEMQQQQYEMIEGQIGAYQSGLEYEEAYKLTQANQDFIIYRFRGEFANSRPEVRVVYTPNNQLAGLRIVPWNDQLQ